MTTYELMVKTNHYMIKSGELSEKHISNIVQQFLKAISTSAQCEKFYESVRFSGNIDNSGRRMYPIYYIPPYNDGKKYKTILGQTPKTHILSANMYELEILRLLHIFAPDSPAVKEMISNTLERLQTTCFGNQNDGVGECFDTSLVVLRFLAEAAPGEKKWMRERIDVFNTYYGERKRIWCLLWYFWLCLSELPFDIAEPEILKHKERIISQLARSCVMNSEYDKTIHPVIICSIRNVMARLPEFEYLKTREPYIGEKDGRLHFNIKKSTL